MPSDTDLDDMTVNEIMHFWPSTVRVFLDRGMLCVGCPIGGFHRLEHAAFEHDIDLDVLRSEITRFIHAELRA